jgi:hypothetical protein
MRNMPRIGRIKTVKEKKRRGGKSIRRRSEEERKRGNCHSRIEL